MSPPIESIVEDANFRIESVDERYFSKYKDDSDTVCVFLHSNRICLVGLSLEHPAVKSPSKVTKIDFQATKKTNRLENSTRGKSKKGGQTIEPESILCHVHLEDGQSFPVRSKVRGKLIEVNKTLEANPRLVIEGAETAKGYLAIVLPRIPDGVEEVKNTLDLCS